MKPDSIAAALALVLCACFASPPTFNRRVLIGAVCTKDSDCGDAAFCSSGVCVERGSPVISGVVGDGPSGRIVTGLVITGDGLADAGARIVAGDASATLGELTIQSANASTLHVTFPEALANTLSASASAVILEVSNLAGAARQQVQILRGEPGDAGPQGPPGLGGISGNRISLSVNVSGVGASPEDDGDTVIWARNTGTGRAIKGVSDGGAGVFGMSNAASGAGVMGWNTNATGTAVLAKNTSPTGLALVTYGRTDLGQSGVKLPIVIKTVAASQYAYCTNDGTSLGVAFGVPMSGSCAGPGASAIGSQGQGIVDHMGGYASNDSSPELGGGYYCNWTALGTTMVVCLTSF